MLTVTYKGLSKTVDQLSEHPDDLEDIDDAVFVGTDLDPGDAALAELKGIGDRAGGMRRLSCPWPFKCQRRDDGDTRR